MKENKRGRFGIGFLGGTGINELIPQVQKAEKMGFSSCWIAEDYFYAGAFSTATACAMVTRSIEIGIGVINPYSRHPVLTAMELGALDFAAKGRTILGVGASNKLWIEDQMGVPFTRPLGAMKETIEIIRRLFREETIEYKGDLFQTGKVKLDFTPFRKEVPIYLGVKGPKALRLAGEVADGVITSIMTSEEYLKYVREQIEAGSEKAGRISDDVKIVSYLVISIDEDREKAREIVKPMLSKYLGLHGVHPILKTTGMKEETMLEFRKAFVAKRKAEHLVEDWMIDTFTVAGHPAECKEKIKALKKAGMDYPIAFQIPGVPIEKTMEQVSTHLFSL